MHTCILFFLVISHLSCKHNVTFPLNTCELPTKTCSSVTQLNVSGEVDINIIPLLLFSPVWLSATPWTIAHQAPLSVGFPRQAYWSGLSFPSPIIFSINYSYITNPVSPKFPLMKKKNSASRSNPGTHIALTCYVSLSPLIWNNPSICLCLLRPWFFLTNKDLLYSTGNSA